MSLSSSIIGSLLYAEALSSGMSKRKMLKLSEYCDIIKAQREKFVMEHFSDQIEALSLSLKKDALNMKPCNKTQCFQVPGLYDVYETQCILQEYFRDCGYRVIASVIEDTRTIEVDLS